MNLFEQLRQDILAAIGRCQAAGSLPLDLASERITAEPPRDPSHGDVATNAALVLAKQAKMAPATIAASLAAELEPQAHIAAVEIVKPGFVNIKLTDEVWRAELKAVLTKGQDYGEADLGKGETVNVEYCSANPTGPLHVGHVRGTVFGDALASLLAKMGWQVTREYYVNDGGAQIDHLARSVYHRYLEALGLAPDETPEGWYPGDYLVPLGRQIAEQDKERWQYAAEVDWLPVFRSRAIAAMMELVRGDLAALDVHHDIFTSEDALVYDGKIDEAFTLLEALDLVYEGTLPPPKGKTVDDWEPASLLLFKAMQFGDDIDRPLKSSSGELTYFAKDLAYHLDKLRRGSKQLINVWGADHGGYVKRMQAAVKALTDGKGDLDVKVCQLVNLLDDGEPVRMSKRAGTMLTLRDVVDKVGKDVVRFIMLTRKNDAPLDFDFVKVTEQSRDNPVFYVQYAHARICSVQRNAIEAGLDVSGAAIDKADLGLLNDAAELALIKQLAVYPRMLAAAAEAHEPHRIAFFLGDLAASFHALWNQGKDRPELRFLHDDKPDLTLARLALIAAVQTVLASGLGLIGVEPVEEMT